MRKIIEFFATEHLLGNLLTVMLLIVGIVSTYNIRRDIWPSVNFDITVISTTLPGASPEQIENLIINPIEEALREVDGIKKVTSNATESTGVVILQLDPDARDSAKTNRDIRNAIDIIDSFPEDASDPVIQEQDSSLAPIVEVTVSGGKTYGENRRYAQLLYDEISLMRDVGKVTKQGYFDEEFHVIADPDLMAQKNISLGDIINSLGSNNISLPAGDTYNDKDAELLIRTEAEFKSAEEIGEVVIRANDVGFNTRVKDVAQVLEAYEDPNVLYKVHGEDSIHLTVSKKANADALDLISELRENVKIWTKDFPEEIHFGFSRDFSKFLSARLSTLTSNLLLGLVLVLIVLSLFLPWQVTVVVSVGIPIALLSAIAVASLAGGSLNLVSLIGLIIVLGMLVDDAIVVSENVWRHIEEGKEVTKAVIDGTREVFGPVLASILTTVCAFGPMLFMTGIFGKFIYEIPFMVIIALGFSLFEAFIIMPSHIVSWVGPFINNIITKKQSGSDEPQVKWYDKYIVKYQNYVVWSIKRKYTMLASAILLLIATGALLAVTGKFVLFPSEGEQFFFVHLESPKGTSLEQMKKNVIPVEKAIENLPKDEVTDVVAIIGLIQQDPNDPQTRRGTNYANIRVELTPKFSRTRNVRQISEQLRKELGDIPNIISMNIEVAKEGPPQGRSISLNVTGRDFQIMNEIAQKVKEKLKTYDGVIDIRDSYLQGKDEWQVLPIKSVAASSGLSASEIAQTVRAAFAGIKATSVRNFDEEIDVLVKQKTSEGPVLDQLNSIKVGNRTGNLVHLNEVAEFKKVSTRNVINHVDFNRIINVSAEVDRDKITSNEVISDIVPFLKELVKDKHGYDIELGGESEDTDESLESLGRAFGFAAMSILFLLIITFRSLIQPLLILTSMPLGFIGVTFAMVLHNRPFSFMSMLGVVALAGVIVNNSIVYIDFVNKLRAQGLNLTDSIVETAGKRLRPIILTTTTTVSGLFPTAYGGYMQKFLGIGGEDAFVIPLALALGWGLAFGSVLTSLFIPPFISITDDLKELPNKLMRKA
ncbi:MAG: efflux RND transporter permease subunit [Bdellovibrionales bacterium]